MQLYLHHGREKPEQDMENWGPVGPRLQDVKGIHQTYGNPANVFFTSPAAAVAAQKLTGWATWDDHALTMLWREDLIEVSPPGAATMFYGDWGLM